MSSLFRFFRHHSLRGVHHAPTATGFLRVLPAYGGPLTVKINEADRVAVRERDNIQTTFQGAIGSFTHRRP